MLVKIDVGTFSSPVKQSFTLDGFVNNHNYRIWQRKKPYAAVQSSLNSPKVILWTTITYERVIGSFFQRQTITAVIYMAWICNATKFLEDLGIVLCLMQGGIWIHRKSQVFNFLIEHSDDCVIALDNCKHMASGIDWLPIIELKQYTYTACKIIPSVTLLCLRNLLSGCVVLLIQMLNILKISFNFTFSDFF